MSMMVSFVLSFFPRDVLDEILNLIDSVSEDFPSYSFRNWPNQNPKSVQNQHGVIVVGRLLKVVLNICSH